METGEDERRRGEPATLELRLVLDFLQVLELRPWSCEWRVETESWRLDHWRSGGAGSQLHRVASLRGQGAPAAARNPDREGSNGAYGEEDSRSQETLAQSRVVNMLLGWAIVGY